MTFTFTIRISRHFSSAREFQMGNFQKHWSQNVDQNFIVLDFFHRRKILKVDGRNPQNRENIFLLGEIVREINVSCAGDPVHAGDKEVGLWHTLRWLEVWWRQLKIVINRCANRSETTFDAEENFLFRSNVQWYHLGLSCYGLFGTKADQSVI